jgi:hypothetical protein
MMRARITGYFFGAWRSPLSTDEKKVLNLGGWVGLGQ